MKKKYTQIKETDILRQNAIKRINERKTKDILFYSETDLLKMVHELEVHQIELEMQNEELVLAKEKADAANQKYSELYNLAPYGYFSLSLFGEIIEFNLFGAKLLGKENQQLKGCRFGLFVSSVTLPVFNNFLLRIFNSNVKESCDIALSVKDKLPVYVHLIGVASDDGKQCHMTMMDVTETKLAEEALRELEEKSLLVFSNIKDVIYSVDILTKEFIYLSPSFERITGYSLKDIKEMGGRNKFMRSVVNIEKYEEWYDFLDKLNEGCADIDFNYETLWLCKNGSFKYLHDHWVPVFVKGRLNSISGILTDITDRKEAEEDMKNKVQELILLNKELEEYTYANQELKQFGYLASHQLQEPIRTVSNFTKIIEEDYSSLLDLNGLKYLQTIIDATQRMAILIDTLMEFSRLGRNRKLEKVDCNKLVEDVLADLKTIIITSQANVEVAEMPHLNLYDVEIRQVFQNLIINGIKFRKKNTPPSIKISSEQLDHKWKFSVSDNGIGIDPIHFEKIFDIFQRLHTSEEEYEGKGIGLAYCKKIVHLHLGEIWVESSEGEGSTFHFTIPDL